MHPFKERMQLAPKMVKQLTKTLKVLVRIQEGPEEIDPELLAEHQHEKGIYLEMERRFQELSNIIDGNDNDRPEGGYPPTGGPNPPSGNVMR